LSSKDDILKVRSGAQTDSLSAGQINSPIARRPYARDGVLVALLWYPKRWFELNPPWLQGLGIWHLGARCVDVGLV